MLSLIKAAKNNISMLNSHSAVEVIWKVVNGVDPKRIIDKNIASNLINFVDTN